MVRFKNPVTQLLGLKHWRLLSKVLLVLFVVHVYMVVYIVGYHLVHSKLSNGESMALRDMTQLTLSAAIRYQHLHVHTHAYLPSPAPIVLPQPIQWPQELKKNITKLKLLAHDCVRRAMISKEWENFYIATGAAVEPTAAYTQPTGLSFRASLPPKPEFYPEKPRPRKDRFAVVIPFGDHSLQQIKANMQSWQERRPCVDDINRQAVLIFVWDQKWNSMQGIMIQMVINRTIAQVPTIKSCFDSVEFVDQSLPANLKHIDAAGAMFYKMFSGLESRYDSFFLMEPDAWPVIDNWLPVVAESADEMGCDQGQFWQMGSVAMCEGDYGSVAGRRDFHINGNSFYALGCAGFDEFMLRVQLHYPPFKPCLFTAGGCTGEHPYEAGYDHAFFNFRQDPANGMYTQAIYDRFTYGTFIMNLCEHMYPSTIGQDRPGVAIVHSKAVFRSDIEHRARRAIKKILGTETYTRSQPFWPVRDFLYRKIRDNVAITHEMLLAWVCEARSRNLYSVLRGWKFPGKENECKEPLVLQAMEQTANGQELWRAMDKDHVYVWTSDFEGSPIACDTPILREVGFIIQPQIDDSLCYLYGNCKDDTLKVISANKAKGYSLDLSTRQKFFQAYYKDPEFQRVDAFICSYPIANCELFLPFDRSIIIRATTRVEMGRTPRALRNTDSNHKTSTPEWREWVQNLIRIGKDPRNIITANNMYDAQYIQYQTGIQVTYLPTWCGNQDDSFICPEWTSRNFDFSYSPTHVQYLIGPLLTNLEEMSCEQDPKHAEAKVHHHSEHPLITGFLNKTTLQNLFKKGKEAYLMSDIFSGQICPCFESILNSDKNCFSLPKAETLVQYPAIVMLPHQVSFTEFHRYYRLNIPMFFPTDDFLWELQQQYSLLWERVYGFPERQLDLIQGVPMQAPDPNDVNSKESFWHWIAYADWNTWPHILRYSSFHDLEDKLLTMSQLELYDISGRMFAHNQLERDTLKKQWQDIMAKAKHGHLDRSTPDSFEEGMQEFDLAAKGNLKQD